MKRSNHICNCATIVGATLLVMAFAVPSLPAHVLNAQAAAATGRQAAAMEALPKAEQVMDWYVEASGGQAAYDKINNRVTKSTLEITGAGIKYAVTLHQAKPNKTYSVIESAATGKIESGCNGDVVWELSKMAGPQLKEGKERATLLHMNTMDRLAYWRKAYKDVQLSGIEDVSGRACYKVIATPNDLPAQTLFFDRDSHLIAKVATIVESQMGTLPIETSFSDFRVVDGLRIPFKGRMKILTQDRQINVESIQHNVELPTDCFDLPADIKAILKKAP